MAKHKESDELKINKLTMWKASSMVLGILLIVSILTGGFAFGDNTAESNSILKEVQPNQPGGNAAPSAPSAPSLNMADLIDDDEVKGNPNAPVTIIEWSDFECPFCGRFYNDAYKQIKTQYIDTGKVKFVYRDFPLGFHANAQKAAEAAECAGEQDKFWEMHNMLFESGVEGGVSLFKQYASQLGLDTSEFNECLDSGRMTEETQKDMRDGQALGITGTPGFIINSQLVVGAQPFSAFKQVIDAELTK